MRLLFSEGDLGRIQDSDLKMSLVVMILGIDWGWSELFMIENRNNLKIGMIKILCMGEIRSATTMDIIEIVSKL